MNIQRWCIPSKLTGKPVVVTGIKVFGNAGQFKESHPQCFDSAVALTLRENQQLATAEALTRISLSLLTVCVSAPSFYFGCRRRFRQV